MFEQISGQRYENGWRDNGYDLLEGFISHLRFVVRRERGWLVLRLINHGPWDELALVTVTTVGSKDEGRKEERKNEVKKKEKSLLQCRMYIAPCGHDGEFQ